MGGISKEIARLERLERGEKLRKKAMNRQREKSEKVAKEIIMDIVRKIERTKKEETRLEMREIKAKTYET